MQSDPPRERDDPYDLIDAYYGCADGTRLRWDIAAFIMQTASLPGRDSRVVDLGCGTGCITVALAHLATRVYAVDNCPMAIERTRRRISHWNVGNIEVLPIDWVSIADSIGPEAVDLAFCWGNSLGYGRTWLQTQIELGTAHDHVRQTMHAAAKVLRPGGQFLVEVAPEPSIAKEDVRIEQIRVVGSGDELSVLKWSICLANGHRRNTAQRYTLSDSTHEVRELQFVGCAVSLDQIIDAMSDAGFRGFRVVRSPLDPLLVVLGEKP